MLESVSLLTFPLLFCPLFPQFCAVCGRTVFRVCLHVRVASKHDDGLCVRNHFALLGLTACIGVSGVAFVAFTFLTTVCGLASMGGGGSGGSLTVVVAVVVVFLRRLLSDFVFRTR